MRTVDKYSKVARLAGELRRSLARVDSARPDASMVTRVLEHTRQIVALAPEFEGATTTLRDATQIYFGSDRKAIQRYLGGSTALSAAIAGNLKKIEEAAKKKEGAALLGPERPSAPITDWQVATDDASVAIDQAVGDAVEVSMIIETRAGVIT